ncbi:hypothetical protein EYF80_031030 [Liparis tanakae]|uniref:Uncharacterized protein n=1 Tax=Liparis tanakae TaxID=230148 RepID=A0A4Z2H099_9TELE|nr:hypothetical protein EYF80_031030 [Liparis tanakae]
MTATDHPGINNKVFVFIRKLAPTSLLLLGWMLSSALVQTSSRSFSDSCDSVNQDTSTVKHSSSRCSFWVRTNRALHSRGIRPGWSPDPIMVYDFPEPEASTVQSLNLSLENGVGNEPAWPVNQ